MDHYKQTIETYNAIAEAYEGRFMNMNIYNASYDLFCKAVKPGAAVLEMATGPGNITRYILDKRPDLDLLGTDVAPAMVELAKKNNPSATFRVMDCRQISEFEQQFDGIICGFGLPYLEKEDGVNFLRTCCDLLNENGVFYLSFVAGPYESSHVQTSSDGKYSVYFHFYEKEFVIHELEQAGMEIKYQLEVPFKRSAEEIEYHTVLIASKPGSN